MLSEKDERSLIEALKRLQRRLDPEPESLYRQAIGAFAWRNVDAGLAAITYDSALNEPAMAIRSAASTGPRLVTFSGDGVTVDLEATSEGGRRQVVGLIAPPQAAVVEVRHKDGTSQAETDPDGRFLVGDLPAGPVSLVVRLQVGPAIKTDWISL